MDKKGILTLVLLYLTFGSFYDITSAEYLVGQTPTPTPVTRNAAGTSSIAISTANNTSANTSTTGTWNISSSTAALKQSTSRIKTTKLPKFTKFPRPFIPYLLRVVADYKVQELSKKNELPFLTLTEIYEILKKSNTSPMYENHIKYKVCPKLHGKAVQTAVAKLDKLLNKKVKPMKKKANEICPSNIMGETNCDNCCLGKQKGLTGLPYYCKHCVCQSSASNRTAAEKPKNDNSGNKGGDSKSSSRGRRSASGMTPDELAVITEMNIENISGVLVTAHGNCTEKGDAKIGTGTRSMCRSCKYVVRFPAGYYPRNLAYTTCGQGGDIFCLAGEGVCTKLVYEKVILKWKFDSNGNEDGYDEIPLTLSVGCACELIQGSIFEIFI